MRANLAGVSERIDGAEQDFEALKSEIMANIKAHGGAPISLALKDNPKLVRGHKVGVIYVDSSMDFPSVWNRRTAHILYDVRSALDHLVHELYVASKGKRPHKLVAGRLQFPMCDQKRAWTAALRSSPKWPSVVEGIDKRFIDIIHAHQPYRSKAKTRHVLSQLRRFSDLDKHRRPNVVLFAAQHAQIGVKVPTHPNAVVEIDPFGMGRSLKVGTQVAYLRITTHAPPPIQSNQVRVDMSVVGMLYPSLARGVRLETLLAYAIFEARNIVAECRAAL